MIETDVRDVGEVVRVVRPSVRHVHIGGASSALCGPDYFCARSNGLSTFNRIIDSLPTDRMTGRVAPGGCEVEAEFPGKIPTDPFVKLAAGRMASDRLLQKRHASLERSERTVILSSSAPPLRPPFDL